MKKLFFLLLFHLWISCSTVKFIGAPISTPLATFNKKDGLDEHHKRFWHLKDFREDSIVGMSVDFAYDQLIKDKVGEKVIVAVIDSGVDIDHPELREAIWINFDEIPDNGIDDDQNGYIDDVHGWNFLGKSDLENMESVRLQKKEMPGSETFKRFEKVRLTNIRNKKEELNNIRDLIRRYNKSDSILRVATGKEDYSLEEVENYIPKTFSIMEAIIFKRFLNDNQLTKSKLQEYLEGAKSSINAHYNISFDGRAVVGDDPDDFNDQSYGNGNVIGPKKEAAKHGTHVSGIIAADRENNHGNKGVFDRAKIMVLRAVPDGDEYDKDVALAIRYAVDNGAQIINTSFGKGYSPHKEWVWEALRHADKNNVLIVNAAGNSGANIDPGKKKTYITDEVKGKEIVSNFLTVGAVDYTYDEEQVASFSNFGSVNVDIFAPGTEIWSSVPNGKYEYYSGTSMAAPCVTGVAAVILSFFPKLRPWQVKKILMNSGLPLYPTIKNPDSGTIVNPKSLSKSGKIVNLYNALIYASSKKYKK